MQVLVHLSVSARARSYPQGSNNAG